MRCPSRVSRHRGFAPPSSCSQCSEATAPAGAQQTGQTPDPTRFEKGVLAYEAADATAPPRKNAILLAGDSQFFRWKTFAEDLAGYDVVNRGVDSFQFTDRGTTPIAWDFATSPA